MFHAKSWLSRSFVGHNISRYANSNIVVCNNIVNRCDTNCGTRAYRKTYDPDTVANLVFETTHMLCSIGMNHLGLTFDLVKHVIFYSRN